MLLNTINYILSCFKKFLFDNKIINPYDIDGGPACFGDSGGPLWRTVIDKKTKKKVPVLIGVFSFTLWGTCHGTQVRPLICLY